MSPRRSLIRDLEGLLPRGELFQDLPMAPFSSFRCGGPAEVAVLPASAEGCVRCWRYLRKSGIPVVVLGDGANVLIADQGISGVVLCVQHLRSWQVCDGICFAQAGVSISKLAWRLGVAGWAGLDCFFAMPGTLGGALFMNARCYGGEIAPLVEETVYLGESGEPVCEGYSSKDWAYKKSPYQGRKGVILATRLRLQRGGVESLRSRMLACLYDRKRKGHFLYPNAGSVFKNNRAFGMPSGKLIDEVGLCGLESPTGRAAVARWHGNMIVNRGGARADEVRSLVEAVKERVFQSTGFLLEEEIRFVGNWQ